MTAFRCGTISLVGRPNTGKSTLLNRLVGSKLSAVSPRAQTTRNLVRGVVTTEDCQYVFVDSPGLQKDHKSLLYRTMNRRATSAIRDADVVAIVVDANRFGEDDRAVLQQIEPAQKVIAVLNKIDQLPEHDLLLPLIERLSSERDFLALVPASARTGKGIPALLRVLREALPTQPPMFAKDQLTDQDERFFAAELFREKLFLNLGEDLPYRCEVVVDDFKEEGALRRIQMTVFVERESQKAIVIGKGGSQLKKIAEPARRDMEKMFGGKVFLSVWVKVRRGWSDDQRVLSQFGHS
jgi:GTPase